MQYGLGFFVAPMNRCMQRKGRQFDRTGAIDDGAVEIAQQKTARGSLRPEETLGVDQEQFVGVRRQ